jgi:choline dehydrogenase-like flavoprotein
VIGLLADRTRGEVLRYDVVVVGAGAAGITLALELEGSGLSVGLLEGGLDSFTEVSQARYQGSLTLGDDMEYPPLDVSRLRFLGGSTNHWNGWCRPLEPNVFRPRPGIEEDGWPFDRSELDEAYQRAHEWCRLGRFEYGPSNLCADAGLPLPIESNDAIEPVVFRGAFGMRFASEYADALEAAGVDVLLGANLVEISIGAGRVREVSVVAEGGASFVVRGDRFVLACGGLENVRHLLLARGKGASELDAAGLIGVGFMEHPHAAVGYLLSDRTEFEPRGPKQALGWTNDIDGVPFLVGAGLSTVALEDRHLPNTAILFEPISDLAGMPWGEAVSALWGATIGSNVTPVAVRTMFEQRPAKEACLSLSRTRDDLGLPRLRLDWRLTPRDLNDLRQACRLVMASLQTQSFGPFLSKDPTRLVGTLTGGHHHLGGARMHESPTRGVVNADLRCHGVENLYVAGSAVFPNGCFSNPTLTVVALAVRLARTLQDAA